MSATKSFTAVGYGPECYAVPGQVLAWDVSGTFDATWALQVSARGGWDTARDEAGSEITGTGEASGVITIEGTKAVRFRFRVVIRASGTIVTEIGEQTAAEDETASSVAAGADRQVIVNDAGVPAGDEGLTYDKSRQRLAVGKVLRLGSETEAIELSITKDRDGDVVLELSSVPDLDPVKVQGRDLAHVRITGGERVSIVTLTNAQLLALRATPITVVPALGGGLLAEFVSAQLLFDYTAAYTETSDDLAFRYTNGSGAKVSDDIEATGFVDATADTLITARAKGSVLGVANAALVLHNIGDGEFGGGNAANVVRVTTRYRVYDVATGKYL